MAFLVATTSLPAVYRPNGYARTTTAGTLHARAKNVICLCVCIKELEFINPKCVLAGGDGFPPTHWALEHWYVTLQPKWVISEPNGPKIIQFDTKSDHSSSKNVSKIYILYLRDFLVISPGGITRTQNPGSDRGKESAKCV